MKKSDLHNWHNLTTDSVIAELNSAVGGISQNEADRRLIEYGLNELEGESNISPWVIFIEQFKNILIIILLVAVVISALVGEVTDAIVIFIIILFAAGLGFIQEYRAERAIKALKRMAAPLASVQRDQKEAQIPARELVPGDIVVVRMGDKIPADARIIESINLKTNESALTGESLPIEKVDNVVNIDADIGDRTNMLYAGTVAVYGRCKAIVIATGNNTEFGKIAGLLEGVKQEKTPLQINLDKMGRWIAIGAISVCVVLALIGIWRGHAPLEMLIWGISLAVAAVPEALPAVVTISLALGVNRMVQRHALMRRLPAVETLGCTTVICSDKTGTMTQDQMTMRAIYIDDTFVDVSGEGYEPKGKFSIEEQKYDHAKDNGLSNYLISAALCTDVKVYLEEGKWQIKGDPTEAAFVVAALKAGIDIEKTNINNQRIKEIPFTSETKRMTVVCRNENGLSAYSNGAAEVVINACTHIRKQSKELELSESEKAQIQTVIQKMAGNALRVLATAYKRLPDENDVVGFDQKMVLLGLAGMIDPPRAEVKDAIATCDKASIKTVMITGDHKLTAVAIAKELGIYKEGNVLTGQELDHMSQEDLEKDIDRIEVYARVSPEHKLRVVEAFAKKGHVVAMTGDGINDAPALKKADIGVAMGIKGTDVTKEAAAMILTDDNFASIVAAVEEGRAIFGNIKKYLVYLLSCNIGELLLMASAILLGPMLFGGIEGTASLIPLIAIQILYVNLATDGLPALALAVDPHSKTIMQDKPRPRSQTIFTRDIVIFMTTMGLWTCIVPLVVFVLSLHSGKSIEHSQCMCFVTLIGIQFFNAFNCRSMERSVFNLNVSINKWLVAAICWEILLLTLVVYLPALQGPFNTYSMSGTDWLIVLAGSVSILFLAELAKLILRWINRK